MKQVYLVDNSVIQRVHRSVEVAEAMTRLTVDGDLGSCLPQVLEEGFSARDDEEHQRSIAASRQAKVFLEPSQWIANIAIQIQRRLFQAGMGRSVGVSDLQIAATAISHSSDQQRVTVVHYDSDFEHIATVMQEFHHQWIVPRGSAN